MDTDAVLTTLISSRTRRLSASTKLMPYLSASQKYPTQVCTSGHALTCHAGSCPEDHRRIFADSGGDHHTSVWGRQVPRRVAVEFKIEIFWGTR